ncbi:MAG: glycine cleavage T C-terminal barrel domain-containing protein [Acidimicrobiia bacterium]
MPNLAISPRIRTSPFYQATLAAGVTDFTVYNKMLMPLSFGDLGAEYRRLMEAVAIWDVACERQVEVSGPDADRLVQYLVARDLRSMKVGQGKYVAMCNQNGGLINDPVLLKLEDRYWFSLADSDTLLWVAAVAGEGGFDVAVTEPDVSPLAIQGPMAIDLAVDLFGEQVRDLRYFWFVDTHLDDIPLVLCRSGWSKQGGFELFLRDGTRGDELWDRVVAAGERYGIGPGAPNHIERVESGLLSFGGDTTPGSNPFEANMAAYVDTDTAVDYIGKAALAEVVRTGPARLMVGLMLDGDASDAWPLPGRVPVMVGDDQVGTMSAVVRSPRLRRTIGLAQIRTSTVDAQTPVEVVAPTGRFGAQIRPLPFI